MSANSLQRNHELELPSACPFQALLVLMTDRWLWIDVKKPQLRVTDTEAHLRQKGIPKGIIARLDWNLWLKDKTIILWVEK